MTNGTEDTVDFIEDIAIEDTMRKSPATKMENRDSISGEPGAHPIGVGVGAATAGATAGAVAGLVVGPIGGMVGTLVGGIAGGMVGKEVAEQLNPTQLSKYWQFEYPKTEYYDEAVSYVDYDAAYRYGYQARYRFAGASWTDICDRLEGDWPTFSVGESKLSWSEACRAAKDGFERDYNTGCGGGNSSTCGPA